MLGERFAMSGSQARHTASSSKRRWRHHKGRAGELLAALLLIAKGYRILHWRARTVAGEIDLIARRGRRLAFVEVKVRKTLEEAQAAIPPHSQRRLIRAAESWVGKRPQFQDFEYGMDAIFICPWSWPRHEQNVFYFDE